MTDVPSTTAAAPAPTGRRRGPVAPRPDDRLVLLEAIQHRDAPRARRLAERWVHRRGVASLESFVQQELEAEAGSESSRWFGELLGQPSAAPSPGAAPLPLGAAVLGGEIGLKDLDSSLAAPPSPLPSVEEAFAALAAEFAPSPAELEQITRAGLDQVDASLLPPPPPSLSFAIAPAAAEPAAAVAPASEEDPAPVRPWFGRVRGLLRTCFDEAIGSLSPAPLAPELSPQEDTQPAAFAAAPGEARDQLPGEGRDQALVEARVEAAVASEVEAEPLAPWPAFHPTASILAALPDPPAAAPAPTPARWLPRLGLVAAPSPRPAPAPADLADLRAWLPDVADDLPRAC